MPGMSLGEIDSFEFDLTESEEEFDERASSLFERPPVGAGSYNLTCTQQNSGSMQGSEQQSFETTVIKMLQEHQVQFQRLFAGQTSMEDRQCRMEGYQHDIDKKFSMLPEKLDRYSATSPSSSSSNDGKRKRVVTCALSVSGSILLVFRLFLVSYSNPGIYYYADLFFHISRFHCRVDDYMHVSWEWLRCISMMVYGVGYISIWIAKLCEVLVMLCVVSVI